MSKKTPAITAGVALLAGITVQASEIATPDVKAEISADIIEEMVFEKQLSIDQNGVVRVDKGLFEVLRERGILNEKEVLSDSSSGIRCGGVPKPN
ncbi:hypothetical protein [Bdellovibrio reynosensis]|uniref:Uncharacterized protein n=1 Tax=Bdellovibrio reynosensis TaxID=2835041 RepID=A0ABY4C7Q7_9BACT|nr:hypothetical protein [Bdellovibrio reynosensis]UOF00829.1 hypothetical protein MNR06_14100 [Bdellovibrio reynosensis]